VSWKTQHGVHGASPARLADFLDGPGPPSVRQTDRQQCTYGACSSGDEHGARPGRGAALNQLQREMFSESRISIAPGHKCLPAPSRTVTPTTRGSHPASSDFSELACMTAGRHASSFPEQPAPALGICADLYESISVPIGRQIGAFGRFSHLSIKIIRLHQCRCSARRKVVLHW
jgi:hypothetical protein